jgi:hypothetical protein
MVHGAREPRTCNHGDSSQALSSRLESKIAMPDSRSLTATPSARSPAANNPIWTLESLIRVYPACKLSRLGGADSRAQPRQRCADKPLSTGSLNPRHTTSLAGRKPGGDAGAWQLPDLPGRRPGVPARKCSLRRWEAHPRGCCRRAGTAQWTAGSGASCG